LPTVAGIYGASGQSGWISGRELTLTAEARYFDGVPDLRSHLAQIESADFWRRINPHLGVTDTPFADRPTTYEFAARDIARARQQICEEGYLHSGPGVSAADCQARVTAQNLEVFLLGPRWVDGSTDVNGTGETHTAVTRSAYRVTSDVPIIAYQFNPLENVNVFSNDATLLLPAAALGGGGGRTYVVAGWPQTIATSQDPSTSSGTSFAMSAASGRSGRATPSATWQTRRAP